MNSKGHSVIIRQGTLDYVHTHALVPDQSSHEGHTMGHQMQKKPDHEANEINFATSFPQAGAYKIFTQFQHNGKVIATDCVVKVN